MVPRDNFLRTPMPTGTNPFRWALHVTGERIDIEEALTIFGEAIDPTIRKLDDQNGHPITVLTSPQLDTLADTREVYEAAQRLLGIVNGMLFIADPGRVPLKPGGILERGSHGGWNQHLLPAAGLIRIRSRARATPTAIVGGKEAPEYLVPSSEQRWSAAAQTDTVVGDVLLYRSGEPDWFNIYKAFEMMRDDINCAIGQHQEQAIGWPAKKALDHFTLSIQVYRHAPPWDGDYTPAKAMRLSEAAEFVQSLARMWLKWRVP
jgi:hypothetical protein